MAQDEQKFDPFANIGDIQEYQPKTTKSVEQKLFSSSPQTEKKVEEESVTPHLPQIFKEERSSSKISDKVDNKTKKHRNTPNFTGYLRPEQLEKLDEIADEMRKKLKDRNISRQSVLRIMVDACDNKTVEHHMRLQKLDK